MGRWRGRAGLDTSLAGTGETGLWGTGDTSLLGTGEALWGTADTGLSLCLARKGVGEGREKEARVLAALVELGGRGAGVVKVARVGRSGTAGTACRSGEGTAATGSRSSEEKRGVSACCARCLRAASSSLALSSLKLCTWGLGRGSLAGLARASLAPG